MQVVRITLLIAAMTASASVAASTTDCQNLHVGGIWIEKGQGLKAVVFLNARGDSSGSYWAFFSGWSVDEKKQAFSVLTAAKASNHRVAVETFEADGCGIQSGARELKSIRLTNNP
jgi:hypothetical protein